jgi:2,3-diketo-5-methylthio-1-phosphopentane phosphatase
MLERDPPLLIVQCDFDDTITDGNVSLAIREAFGIGDWHRLEKEYVAGSRSVEESNIIQYAMVRASTVALSEFLSTQVVVRDGFEEFADKCQREGTRLVVVSSGLDVYIHPTMKRLGLGHLEVHSGTATVTGSGMQIEYADPSGNSITRGFKESFLREFKRKGHTVIYIGDGLSDIVPASEADFVIARSTLERHFVANGLPHYSFGTFEDVGRHVEEIRRLPGG